MKRWADTSLPGMGHILGAYPHPFSSIVAIACEFRCLTQPPARAAYGGNHPNRRLGLYKQGKRRPFAYLDTLKHPVNDIAFHPRDPVLAIATGRYDGGWFFEGALLLWNWETGKFGRPLVQSPEIKRVAFTPDGDVILAYARPWTDQDGDAEAFNMFFELRGTYFDDLSQGVGDANSVQAQMDRQTPKQEDAVNSDTRFREKQDIYQVISRLTGLSSVVSRSPTWDIAWLDDDTLGFVHDDCHLQTVKLRDGTTKIYQGDGHGSEILLGSKTYVHVVTREETSAFPEHSSSIITPLEINPWPVETFTGAHTFSISDTGQFLGRRMLYGRRLGKDPLDRYFEGQSWREVALGHYDPFNHFIRIDGAPYLFFVQNKRPFADPLEPSDPNKPSSPIKHQEKWVCILDEAGQQKRLWPVLRYDGTPSSHPMECSFAYLNDELGEALIVGGEHFGFRPREGYKGFVYRRDLWTGKELWRHSLSASPSQIKFSDETGMVLVFTLSGEYLIINAKTGILLVRKSLKDEGMPTVAFSVALNGINIALGTMDGGVLTTDIEELLG